MLLFVNGMLSSAIGGNDRSHTIALLLNEGHNRIIFAVKFLRFCGVVLFWISV